MMYPVVMGLRRTILLAGLLLFTAACGDNDDDDWTVVWKSGGGTRQTTGGAIVGVKNAEVEPPGWVFEDPVPFEGELPGPSLMAIGDALFNAGADADVVDAVKTGRGTVALVRSADGELRLVHYEGETPATATAPAGAFRLIRVSTRPLEVRVLVAHDVAVPATRSE
jgi:hypothetical protein